MRRDDLIAVKILGMFVLGGAVMAGGVFVVSLLVPTSPTALRIGMGVFLGVFAVMGLVVAARYRLWSSRGGRQLRHSAMLGHMTIEPLGELVPDDRIERWMVSEPVDVPLLGVRVPFVVEDLEGDPAPQEVADAVRSFLALGPRDLATAAPHVYGNYRRFIEAVGEAEFDFRIGGPEAVWSHVHPTQVHVSRRHRRDKKVYVQVTAECDWEVEHGLQLVYRAGRELTRVSEQDGHLTHSDAYDLPEGEDRISE